MKTPKDEGMNHATTGGGHHTERPCSVSKLDLVKKQTGGTEGGKAGISPQRQCRAGCATGPEIVARKGLAFPLER